MISFTDFIAEGMNKKAHFFDMDETLLSHDPKKLKIHVRDHEGKLVKSLTNQEFNRYKLKPGEKHDFKNFASAKKVGETSKPIHKMINKMNSLHKTGHKVEIVTARGDLDNKHEFKKQLAKHNIDIDKIHVRRAGNVQGTSTGDRKRKVISDQIKAHKYNEVHLYDDDAGNHAHFSKLKDDHPGVALYSHLVKHNERTGKTEVKTTRH